MAQDRVTPSERILAAAGVLGIDVLNPARAVERLQRIANGDESAAPDVVSWLRQHLAPLATVRKHPQARPVSYLTPDIGSPASTDDVPLWMVGAFILVQDAALTQTLIVSPCRGCQRWLFTTKDRRTLHCSPECQERFNKANPVARARRNDGDRFLRWRAAEKRAHEEERAIDRRIAAVRAQRRGRG